MDPLSVTAASIETSKAIQQAALALFQFIRTTKAAPGALYALSNELADLQIVLQEVTKLLDLNEEVSLEGDNGYGLILSCNILLTLSQLSQAYINIYPRLYNLFNLWSIDWGTRAPLLSR
jgi:hypothetical protein